MYSQKTVMTNTRRPPLTRCGGPQGGGGGAAATAAAAAAALRDRQCHLNNMVGRVSVID